MVRATVYLGILLLVSSVTTSAGQTRIINGQSITFLNDGKTAVIDGKLVETQQIDPSQMTNDAAHGIIRFGLGLAIGIGGCIVFRRITSSNH